MRGSSCCRAQVSVVREELVCDACGSLCEAVVVPERAVIGIAGIKQAGIGWIYVICDDGSVWKTAGDSNGWVKLEPVPGTKSHG